MKRLNRVSRKLLVLAVLGAATLLGGGCMVVPYDYGYYGHHGHHGYHGYSDGYRTDRYRRW